MSTMHQDKAISQLELTPSSPSTTKMTTTPEPLLTDKDSEDSSLPKPIVSSSNAKDGSKEQDESKDESDNVSKISDDDENADSAVGAKDNSKRFLPAYKKANAALTFPEKVRHFNGACAIS